eukprot:CAMPEP_0169231450 /NCGR_PEP_ID=MMETSP1016-20121227/26510_1 /TAXON_ID=342587 /ORGANISM="Karlodinium micrum, Strain CCMP2283" /LENGTH=154 /DNA_ID=CAMNT_0009310569 /DNA_START=61 /DNA_END=522 /DNA_ORIENTATION=+
MAPLSVGRSYSKKAFCGRCVSYIPYLILGIVVTCLSTSAPATCTTDLHGAFLAIGITLILYAVLGAGSVAINNYLAVDLHKHKTLTAHYEQTDRQDKADKEEKETVNDIEAMAHMRPFLCIMVFCCALSLCMWIWGVAAASSAHRCGSAPTYFW